MSQTPAGGPEAAETLRLADVAEFETLKAEADEATTVALPAEEVSEAATPLGDAAASLLAASAKELVEPGARGLTAAKAATPSGAAAKVPGCRCALREEAAGKWGDCFGGCLSSWGVSPAMLIMCGVSCGVGAVPVCAACVGVSVTIAELCAIGCAIYAA